jgi:nucleotide-binding universal stress UspA family protein
MGVIVVGLDASAESRRALSWALAEAHLRDAELLVVSAWHVPSYAYGGVGLVPVLDRDLESGFERAAEHVVREALDGVSAAARGTPVEQAVVHGSAAHSLVEASDGADLLVVGSRGHGGFTGLLLGSVSQQCARHARCPVVVVPHDR